MNWTRAALAFGLFLGWLVPIAAAGEVLKGQVFVCRKPMLLGDTAAAQLLKPGPDAARAIAELLKEEQDNCYYAAHVEITGGGESKVDIGWNQWCREFTGLADGVEIFVQIGSQNKTYGRCP